MTKKQPRGPLLGLSFTEDSVHAVVTRLDRSGQPEIVKAARTDLPHGLIAEHGIQDFDVLAQVLRRFLVDNKIESLPTVVGLPSRTVFARQITIPPVLGDVRRAVIRGEIDHLSLLPPGQGAFDYIPFDIEEENSTPGEPVFFFAAEHSVIAGFSALIQDVGLKIIGVEPAEYAAVRTIYPQVATRPLALVISIGSGNTTLLFYKQGKPIYARRLDLGHSHLIVPEVLEEQAETATTDSMPIIHAPAAPEHGSVGIGSYSDFAGPTSFAEPFFDDTSEQEPNSPWDTNRLHDAEHARRMLVQEIGRSLDYFVREKRSDLAQLHTALLPNNIDLAGMPVYTSALLEMDIELGDTLAHVTSSRLIPADRRQEFGLAYAPALGLTLGHLGAGFEGAQIFDLMTEDASVVRARKAPGLLRNASLCAGALLSLGAGGFWYLTTQDIPVRANLEKSKASLATAQGQEKLLRTEQNQQLELVQEIRTHNIPWTTVLRVLSQTVPVNMGLTNVAARGSILTIEAETQYEDTIPVFGKQLQATGFFTNVLVDSTSRDKDKIRLTVTASLPNADLQKEAAK
ncbi:MAG: pilus assembly protein PilM [Armatimonas sp.]